MRSKPVRQSGWVPACSASSFIGSTLGDLSLSTNITHKPGPGTGLFSQFRDPDNIQLELCVFEPDLVRPGSHNTEWHL